MKNIILTSILSAALALTGCKKQEQVSPEPAPARELTMRYFVFTYGDPSVEISRNGTPCAPDTGTVSVYHFFTVQAAEGDAMQFHCSSTDQPGQLYMYEQPIDSTNTWVYVFANISNLEGDTNVVRIVPEL